MRTVINGVTHERVIKNVWHLPAFQSSLLSSNQLKREGMLITNRYKDMDEYVFDEDHNLWMVARFRDYLNFPDWQVATRVIGKSPKPSQASRPSSQASRPSSSTRPFIGANAPTGQFASPTSIPGGSRANFAKSNTATDPETPALWHQRLGHMSMRNIQTLLKRDGISGITVPPHEFARSATDACEVCMMGKHNRAAFHQERSKPITPMMVASSDIAGPYPDKTLNGSVYVVTLVDWCTSFGEVALLQDKSDASEALKRIIIRWEAIHKRKLELLYSDRGGEYIDHKFAAWLKERGTRHEFSPPYSPQQNGVAERMNQTLNNMVRSMMCQYASYPPLWGEAMMYAARIKNVMLNKHSGVTPYEAWHGKVPDVSNFRTFGCKVYCRIPDEHRTKLEPKSRPGIYCGPEHHGAGYRVLVYKPEYKRAFKFFVGIFRDIVCFENQLAVTGKENVAQAHWGGHIPLPAPKQAIQPTEGEAPSESLIALDGSRPLHQAIASWHKKLTLPTPPEKPKQLVDPNNLYKLVDDLEAPR